MEHKEELVNKYHLNDHRVTIIPFGVDKARQVDVCRVQEVMSKYSLNGKHVVAFFGTIRPNKGIEYLIQGFSKALKKQDNMVLMIAGGASKSWSGYFNKLKQMVDELGIEKDIIFTGFIDELDIPVIMNISKILVLPYTDITQSAVLNQNAIAYTKPVIVTDVGGLGDIIRRYAIGLVIPPKDAGSLSDAILEMIGNEPALGIYRDNEVKMSKEFSWGNVSKIHIDIYRNLSGLKATNG